MNNRQLPWYQDKKTQQAELYNNKNPSQQVDTTPTLVPGGELGKKKKKNIGLRRHVGLRCGMSVSNGSPIRHFGLGWGMSVADKAYQSPMKHVKDFNQACQFWMGLQWVSDNNNISVNSNKIQQYI